MTEGKPSVKDPVFWVTCEWLADSVLPPNWLTKMAEKWLSLPRGEPATETATRGATTVVTKDQVRPGLKVRVLRNTQGCARQVPPPHNGLASHLLEPGNIIALNGETEEINFGSYKEEVAWYADYKGRKNYIPLEDVELTDEPVVAAPKVCHCDIWAGPCTCGKFAEEQAAKAASQD